MTTRKPAARRKTRTTSTPARASAPAKARPQPGPGEEIFILDVPYEERAVAQVHGAVWDSGLGHVFVGRTLPTALERYRPRPYSWQAWIEADQRGNTHGNPTPTLDTGRIKLRADQVEDMQTFLTAIKAGAPEILIGSWTGVGKTPTTVALVNAIPGVRNVLVIAPLAVLPSWRNHLTKMGDGGRRWCVINPGSVKKLIEKPGPRISSKTGKAVKSKASTVNKQHANNGKLKVAWDVVIFDESHLRANPSTQTSVATDRIIEGPGGRPALSINLSATAGTNPSELSYLHRGLAFASGERPQSRIDMETYAQWCQARGVGVSVTKRYGEEKLAWEKSERDLAIFHHIIFKSRPQWAVRRKPEGWPEQERILVPVELSLREMDAYETAWEEFEAAMKELRAAETGNAAARKAATSRGLAAQIRYRQKAGMLRAPHSVDYALNLHASGHQVAISCEFIGAVEAIEEGLIKAGHKPAIFTGQNKDTREQERVAFQQGKTPFIIFTPDSSIDLHQGDTLIGGNDIPRALVVAQPRWSPKKSLQIEGRTQRNGQAATTHYLFAQGTREVDVLEAMVAGVRSMAIINGDDQAQSAAMAAALVKMTQALGAPILDD